MRFAVAAAAFVGAVSAQSCASTYDNGAQFQIGIVNETTTASKFKRQAAPDTTPGHALYITLVDGLLKDQNGTLAYFAPGNAQFQFGPGAPQPGATGTSGWGACPNSTLSQGGSTIFYECLSTSPGIASFYNLYKSSTGEKECYPVNLQIVPVSGSASSATSVAASSSTAAPVATSAASSSAASSSVAAVMTSAAPVATTPVTSAIATQVTDGQVQASSAVSAVTQVTDGQIQAPTNATSPVPFTGGAPVIVSGGLWMAVAAGVAGAGAFLL